jgi:hypothetical protein
LGFDLSFPALLAPVGYSRLMHPGGEVAAARAAGAAGTAYILSTISGHQLEDVKAASSGHVFYQLYLMGGREAAEAAIERPRVAGFSALVVTIDTPVSGMRERDFRNGMKELISGGPLNQTTGDSYMPISSHLWVACSMRTKKDSDTHPCAQRTLRRVCQRCVDRFREGPVSSPSIGTSGLAH